MVFVRLVQRLNISSLQSRCTNFSILTFSMNTALTMVFCYQNCSSDREKEGREFAKNLESLEQLVRTVKGQNNFW